jgi:hypothetical protein
VRGLRAIFANRAPEFRCGFADLIALRFFVNIDLLINIWNIFP